MVDAAIWDQEVSVPANVISFVDSQVSKCTVFTFMWIDSDI